MNFTSQSVYYAIAASATALGLACKAWSVIQRLAIKEFTSLKEDREKLRVVFSELTPNHGSSVKDKINNLEQELARNTELTEKAVEKIIINREKLDILYETSDIARFEAELPSGKCIWTNGAYQKMFGLTENQARGDGWLNALHPEDIEPTHTHWQNTIANQLPYKARYRIIVGSTVKKVEVQAKIIQNEAGESISALGTVKVLAEEDDKV